MKLICHLCGSEFEKEDKEARRYMFNDIIEYTIMCH